MVNKKDSFIEGVIATDTQIARMIEAGEALYSTYFDRGYNSGGSDEITNADTEAYGITAANVSAFIALVEQLVKFRDNQAVTQGDYGNTLNDIRNDV